MVNDAAHGITWGTALKNSEVGLAGTLINGSAGVGTTLLVDLYGGTTAGTMTLQQTTTMSLTLAGVFGPKTFTSANLPGATPAFMQVKVRENTFTTAELAQAGGGYYGFSPVFNFNPSSTIAFNSIVVSGGTALSTWAAAPVTVQVAPEPTSMALAGIGAAAMVIFRRRNK